MESYWPTYATKCKTGSYFLMYLLILRTTRPPYPFVVPILRCPEHFCAEWLSKIKDNVPSDNWRLRVSNIKKVIEGVVDFYESALRMPMTVSNVSLPDAVMIGKEGDEKELGRLMQLILVAAVNCDKKEEYIANILTLDTETQLIVKNAIEELFMTFGADVGRNRSSTMESIGSMTFPDLNVPDGGVNAAVQSLKSEVKRLGNELASAIEVKERTIQEMFDLKRELSSVQQENVQLNVENENLSELVNKLQTTPSKSVPCRGTEHLTTESSDTSLKEAFVNKLQARIETLREELFKTENSREEVKIKNELLEKELMDLKFKNEELQRKANEARNLKDELDIHRQASEKAEKYEQMIEVYKKKLEEAAEFKRKIKSAEDRNVSQSSIQISLEEEHRKNSNLKIQNENLKKQVQELHSSAAALTHRTEQSEFELRMIKEKYDTAMQEKERLAKEVTEIRKQTKSRRPTSDILSEAGDVMPAANLGYEISNERDTRIDELEGENQLLRKKIHLIQEQDLTPNRSNSHSNNYHFAANMSPGELGVQKVVDSLRGELYDYQQKVSQLEGVIAKKEEEMAEIEARYRKCVSKAKQVAKVLEPISLSSGNSSINSSIANTEHSAIEIQLRDKQIQELEAEAEKMKQFKEVEERLMSVAFHSLAGKLQRNSVEERLTGRPAAASSTGSFLSRQRQSTGRRFNMPGVSQT